MHACALCDLSFPNPAGLRRHRRLAHPAPASTVDLSRQTGQGSASGRAFDGDWWAGQ